MILIVTSRVQIPEDETKWIASNKFGEVILFDARPELDLDEETWVVPDNVRSRVILTYGMTSHSNSDWRSSLTKITAGDPTVVSDVFNTQVTFKMIP